MKTYITKVYNDAYILTTNEYIRNYSHEDNFDDDLVWNAFCELVFIAGFYSITNIEEDENLSDILSLAKKCNSKFISCKKHKNIKAPVFFNKADAINFKSIVDAKLLLYEMKNV